MLREIDEYDDHLLHSRSMVHAHEIVQLIGGLGI